MKIAIRGIGIWGRGLRNWDEFCSLIAAARNDHSNGDNDGIGAQWQAPAPEAIPARERRRSPLLVRLSVEVAFQACESAGVDTEHVATVFASSMGDTEISDYLCRTLAGGATVLSPTRFHNSVHNAPAGYWSISAGNRAPSSSTACSRESFPLAMLEAGTMSVAEQRPVLLVASDIAVPGPLGAVYPISEPFGVALLCDASAHGDDAWILSVGQHDKRSAWPDVRHPLLRTISECNPAARCMALLEAIATGSRNSVQWPLHDSAYLQMTPADRDARQ